MKKDSAFKVSLTAMFAAIICAGCFIRIPIGAVPVVIQNVLCILTGTILGGFFGCAPTALFLAAGLLGLPVYSGGTGGPAVWLGPTGGFLPGYFAGSLAAGLIAGKPQLARTLQGTATYIKEVPHLAGALPDVTAQTAQPDRPVSEHLAGTRCLDVIRVTLSIIAGMIIVYIPGTIRFAQWALASSKVPADKSAFSFTMASCVLPYIPGDIIKTAAAVPVALAVRKVLARYLNSGIKK